jgi:DNA-directed RNA polymerase subunit M/transcription elongation factor TFIIS
MLLAKLTCPKCRAVLKPAKPVESGKTIKCPKCEELFKAGAPVGEAAKKKPAGAPAPKAEEEEEEQATYAVVRDEEMEKKAEEAERRKERRRMKARMQKKQGRKADPDEDPYADADEDDLAAQILRNLKTRDPRGKAQEMVVTPSNWLLRTGLIGFFGWVIVFICFIIPIVFPNIPDKADDSGDDPRIAAKIKEQEKGPEKERKTAEYDLFKDIREKWWAVALFITVLLIGLVHGGLISYGAVKMQSLESYRWGVTSCVLALIPLYMTPFWVFLWWLFDKLDAENPWAIGCFIYLWGPVVGGLCLKVILGEKVKAGFAFKPD